MSPLPCRICGSTAGPFTTDGRCEDCADTTTNGDTQ